MIRKLYSTDGNTATVILRLMLGIVFFAHGAQKLLGWFGGYGFSATMGLFTGMLHIPAALAFLARIGPALRKAKASSITCWCSR
jgi:putative oxidoreductase